MDRSNTRPTSDLFPPRFHLPEAAPYIGVSPRSLASRGWRIKHGIPTIRIGRRLVFDRAALDAWLRRHVERPLRQLGPEPGEAGEGAGR